MTNDCIFCKIVTKEIPTEILFQDDLVTAFRDIHPVAPTHILIIPNRHITSHAQTTPADEAVIGRMYTAARTLAKQENITENGYRLIINTGKHGGQEVQHIHLHLIGGRKMKYPIG